MADQQEIDLVHELIRERIRLAELEVEREKLKLQRKTLSHINHAPIDGLVQARLDASQEWREFVLGWQQAEQAVIAAGLKLTKRNVANLYGCDAATLTRRQKAHGIAADDWPPSRWNPNKPPR
jgi:hypothetical protein